MNERKTICLLTCMPETAHPKRVCIGAAAQCEKYGYDLVVVSSMVEFNFYLKEYVNGEKNIYNLPNYSKFDGIIVDVIGMTYSNKIDIINKIYNDLRKKTSAPCISVGKPFKDLIVSENSNDQLMRELCRHAIEVHGCKDICLLTGFKDNYEAEDRLASMLDEIHKHGLEVSEDHIIYGDFWFDSGTKLAQDIVSGKVSKPDALIAASDHMALGFIEEYTHLGGHIPEDMIVLGFEATIDAFLSDITLTSIESNYAKCAADAVDILRRRIEPGAEISPYEVDVASALHTGMSCGCTFDARNTLDAVRTSIYFLMRNYTKNVYEDNIDIGLLMESHIPEQLTASRDPEECIQNIYNSAYIVSPMRNFFLCLREDWLDDSRDIKEGYPEKMDLVMFRSKDRLDDLHELKKRITFDTSEMLPQQFIKNEPPSIYYFSAVHFANNTLGYGVLQRELRDAPKYNIVYRNWLRFVKNALEMVRTRNRFLELSINDKMTGLLNRRGMFQKIEKLFKRAKPHDRLFAAVVDMDGLKYINDTFGHSEGDHGIIRVADAVRSIANDGDICCRAGGDEFYILGLREKDTFDNDKYVNDFCENLSKLTAGDDKPYTVTASIGCALSDEDDTDVEKLLTIADENMYRYKVSRRRNRI